MTCAKSLLLWAAVLGLISSAVAAEIAGPLRKHPENGRYFTDDTRDASGAYKAIYLTGSHTWANLIDRGPTDPPAKFDFSAYLDLLQAQKASCSQSRSRGSGLDQTKHWTGNRDLIWRN